MEKRNIRLHLAYDGSHYFGWQKQTSAPTVQGEMEKALHVILQTPTTISGIGRTDSGAHAFRYVAHFLTSNLTMPVDRFPPALNSILPRDIRVLSADVAEPEFHSRFSASAREYVYFLITGTQPLPQLEDYTHYIDTRLDERLLAEACRAFVGQHSFRSFCSGYEESKNFVRKLFHLRFRRLDQRLGPSLLRKGSEAYVFFIKGNGFLKGMIRTILSACVSCADGRISPEMIREALKGGVLLDSKYRSPLSANGLWFKRGFYLPGTLRKNVDDE